MDSELNPLFSTSSVHPYIETRNNPNALREVIAKCGFAKAEQVEMYHLGKISQQGPYTRDGWRFSVTINFMCNGDDLNGKFKDIFIGKIGISKKHLALTGLIKFPYSTWCTYDYKAATWTVIEKCFDTYGHLIDSASKKGLLTKETELRAAMATSRRSIYEEFNEIDWRKEEADLREKILSRTPNLRLYA